MVKLDIISDPICPWCYIGKTLLDRALALRPGHPFEIEWHPFQLNPDMAEGGMDRIEYLDGKYGDRQGTIRAYAPVLQKAEEAGLVLDLSAIRRTPNTLDAHRLIHWAGIEGKQDDIAMALFSACLGEGRDIGDAEVLADIADAQGMDGATIQRLLRTDADRNDIKARDTQFRQMGITGVPTFIVGGSHAVPGCQPQDLWLRVIDELAAQETG